MKLIIGENIEKKPIYDLFDDNGKFIMEGCLVEGEAEEKYFNGFVTYVGKEVFKINGGLISKIIDYNDVKKLIRLNNIT